jgi:hypothetical protein
MIKLLIVRITYQTGVTHPRIFLQIVGIPMGVHCASLIVGVFLY